MRIRWPLAAAAALLAVGVAGCGGDQESETVEITGVDYAYEGVPETVTAGSDLAFANDSDGEVHELVVARIPEDEERSVAELIEAGPAEMQGQLEAGLVGVAVAPPGEEGMVVEGDLTLEESGRYALICMVPIGADPEEFMAAAAESEGPPDVEGGPPHITEGMYAEITVES